MSTGGTLSKIAHHLVRALQPLEEAFSDADSFQVLMLELGWEAPGLPPSYQVIAEKTAQATAALEALEDGPSITEVLSVIDKAGAVYRAMKTLAEAPQGIDAAVFLPELAHRLFEYLLGRQLFSEAPGLYSTLEAIGIIALEDHPATSDRPGFTRFRFDWDQIPNVLSKPDLIPARVYGWGTPDLNFPKIAELLTEVAIALGLPASLDEISEEFAALLQAEATGPPASVARSGMTIVLFDVPLANGETEIVGLMTTELPAEGTALPGIVLVPKVPNGIAERVDLGGGWAFLLRAGTDLATQVGVAFRPDGIAARYPGAPGQTLPSAGFGVAIRYEGESPLVLFGEAGETRLELLSTELTAGIDVQAGDLELRLGITTQGMALVIEPGSADSFLGEILGDKPLRVEIGTTIGWSSRTGLSFMAEGGFGVTVYPNLKAGGLHFERADLGVRFTNGSVPGLQVQAAASFSGAIGPIALSVDQFGVQLPIKFDDGNAGPFDVGFAIKPPTGIGLSINATGVSGAGMIHFEPSKAQYGGFVQLTINELVTVTAVALITTKLPNGARGFSLVIMITALGFKPIPLGLGFTLTAIGGLLALNRTVNEEFLREGIKNQTLNTLLFPIDPNRDAAQIFATLNNAFPPRIGNFLFGPVVRICWGTPPLITMDLALVLEIGKRRRLIILGRVSAIMPSEKHDLLRLQMNALGVIDFDQSSVSLDAVLYDSRLAGKFPITGSMAMRLRWGSDPVFALSIGGFHPAFKPPANFPILQRLAISFSNSSDFKLWAECYIAITSNTLQFGAKLELFASAGGFSIQGRVGFDVLIQFDPFMFVADFHASVQLKRGSRNLFKVKVAGALSGPRPLHVKGKATFEIFWWDFSIRFDRNLVGGEKPPKLAPINVADLLVAALNESQNWSGQLPENVRRLVTVREPQGAQQIPFHPLGTLGVKQNVVPLDLEISRFGNTTPAGERSFKISSFNVSGRDVTFSKVRDFFSPSQFIQMSDEQRLSAPSFELFNAGVSAGVPGFVFGNQPDDILESRIEYETIIVDGELKAETDKSRTTINTDFFIRHLSLGAAARSSLRRTGNTKYRSRLNKYSLAPTGWTILSTEDGSTQGTADFVAGTVSSYSEAFQALQKVKAANPAQAKKLMLVRKPIEKE